MFKTILNDLNTYLKDNKKQLNLKKLLKMKKILSILSFVLFLNVNGQTNFIRPSITVFQTTSKNLDSVLFPGNLDRIYCANNKINFQSITSFDSIGYQKAKQELKKNNNLIFKTVFEELNIGSDNKIDMSKLN